ncbi:hypothetical protein BO71DRAFT_444460 [Aspergillus ellipticus CBS 707.79]|uniref:Uncharacterized protein n=1 Tax=Aspergillus ellipticus CBS 707.79 TaxID=1448320 RepID=A0A319CY20_9EURO|nr:hypothetical protein BO71DRAFT_444460 [Aspergillus ellipticus CBS 707.79]
MGTGSTSFCKKAFLITIFPRSPPRIASPDISLIKYLKSPPVISNEHYLSQNSIPTICIRHISLTSQVATPMFQSLQFDWRRHGWAIFYCAVSAVGALCYGYDNTYYNGVLATHPLTTSSQYVIVVFSFLVVIAFNFGLGPLAYTVAREMAVGVSQNKIMATSMVVFYFTTWVVSFTALYMYYDAGLGPMVSFVYAGTTGLAVLWTWGCVGETGGRENSSHGPSAVNKNSCVDALPSLRIIKKLRDRHLT